MRRTPARPTRGANNRPTCALLYRIKTITPEPCTTCPPVRPVFRGPNSFSAPPTTARAIADDVADVTGGCDWLAPAGPGVRHGPNRGCGAQRHPVRAGPRGEARQAASRGASRRASRRAMGRRRGERHEDRVPRKMEPRPGEKAEELRPGGDEGRAVADNQVGGVVAMWRRVRYNCVAGYSPVAAIWGSVHSTNGGSCGSWCSSGSRGAGGGSADTRWWSAATVVWVGRHWSGREGKQGVVPTRARWRSRRG